MAAEGGDGFFERRGYVGFIGQDVCRSWHVGFAAEPLADLIGVKAEVDVVNVRSAGLGERRFRGV
jgi:hypothetical protein